MPRTAIVAAVLLVTAVVAILGVTVINAYSPRQVTTAPASASIDVMQMMKDAKSLPNQQFDAH